MELFKVRIIKSSLPTYWYVRMIDKEFTVCNHPTRPQDYDVKHPDYPMSLILKEDAELVGMLSNRQIDAIVAKHVPALDAAILRMDINLRITRYADNLQQRVLTMHDLRNAVSGVIGISLISCDENHATSTVVVNIRLSDHYYTNLILFKEAVEDLASYGQQSLPLSTRLKIQVVNVPYKFWRKFPSFVNPYLQPYDKFSYDSMYIREMENYQMSLYAKHEAAHNIPTTTV